MKGQILSAKRYATRATKVEQDIALERARDILAAVKTICFSHMMFDCETIKCEDCALSKEIDLGLGEYREPFDLCELITTIRGAVR